MRIIFAVLVFFLTVNTVMASSYRSGNAIYIQRKQNKVPLLKSQFIFTEEQSSFQSDSSSSNPPASLSRLSEPSSMNRAEDTSLTKSFKAEEAKIKNSGLSSLSALKPASISSVNSRGANSGSGGGASGSGRGGGTSGSGSGHGGGTSGSGSGHGRGSSGSGSGRGGKGTSGSGSGTSPGQGGASTNLANADSKASIYELSSWDDLAVEDETPSYRLEESLNVNARLLNK